MDDTELKSFYSGKKVLITGHTGFKGSWLTLLLSYLGADVVGFSLGEVSNPSLFELCKPNNNCTSYYGDIRDLKALQQIFEKEKPEIVFHLAAQPLVRESYQNPVYTYETNVCGTIHVLECIRKSTSVQSVVIITTDKVYENVGKMQGYVESDILNGYDPYSNSKSCAELVTSSYVNSYLREQGVPVSTLRAGNVIGGGDFAKDRLLPDCVRSLERNETVTLRHPAATRPFQHVMDPLLVYIMIGMKQANDASVAGAYNVGPNEEALSVGDMVRLFEKYWNEDNAQEIAAGVLPKFHYCVQEEEHAPHEAAILQLNSTKVNTLLQRKPHWNSETAIQKTVEWTMAYLQKKDIYEVTMKQIKDFMNL